jgi:hypothetical protein
MSNHRGHKGSQELPRLILSSVHPCDPCGLVLTVALYHSERERRIYAFGQSCAAKCIDPFSGDFVTRSFRIVRMAVSNPLKITVTVAVD